MCLRFHISASEQLVLEAEEKGEQQSNNMALYCICYGTFSYSALTLGPSFCAQARLPLKSNFLGSVSAIELHKHKATREKYVKQQQYR